MPSLASSVSGLMESSMNTLGEQLATKFKLDKNEVCDFLKMSLESGTGGGTEFDPTKDVKTYTKPELAAFCKQKNLKCTGNKSDLYERLTSPLVSEKTVTKKVSKDSKVPKVSKDSSSKLKENDAKAERIMKSNVQRTEDTDSVIRVNEHGNFMHIPTKLVFNKKTGKAYGRQQDDGTVSDLDMDDIEQCKRYNYQYTIPENLGVDEDDEEIEEIEDVCEDDDDEDDD